MMSTEACVLSSLIRRPAHGYELQQLLRRYTDVHSMKKVNVYIVLRALERELARCEWHERLAQRPTTDLGVSAVSLLAEERQQREREMPRSAM